MINGNFKIVVAALAIAMWYNATARLYDLLVPHVDWLTTILMFIVATVVLMCDDGTLKDLGVSDGQTTTAVVAQRTPGHLPPLLLKAARKPGPGTKVVRKA